MRRRPSPTALILAALVLLALVVRLAFFLPDQQPREQFGLAGQQGDIARNIDDTGRWFVLHTVPPKAPPGTRGRLVDPSDLDYTGIDKPRDFERAMIHMQGVAVLEAGIWKVTGDKDYGYVQVLQIIVSALTVLVVYWIAMRLFQRRRAALIAAFLYAVALPIAALMKIPFYDTWATLTVAPLVALWLKAADATGRRRLWLLLATGVVAGVGVYFRPPIGFLPLALALAWIPQVGWRRSAQLGLVPVAVAVVILAPWTIKNAVQWHRFIPANIGFGQVLWQGLGERPNNFGAHNDDVITLHQVQKVRPDLRYNTPAYDSFLAGWARKAIREHPGHYADVVAHRLLDATVLQHSLSWNVHAVAIDTNRKGSIVSFAVHHPWEAFQLAMSAIGDRLLIILAVLTALLTWRRFRNQHLFLLAIVLATLLVPVILAMEWRYIAPAAFVYMILFGLGVDLVLEKRAYAHSPCAESAA